MLDGYLLKNTTIEKTVSVGRISFVNTNPVYYGLENGQKPDWLNLLQGPPSLLNAEMLRGALDISPISSAAYARNPEKWLLLPGLSISCDRRVMSVLLVSKYKFNNLSWKRVVLTDESATASDLLKVLFAEKKIKSIFTTGRVKSVQDIDDETDAALVIGDAAITGQWQDKFEYVADLGQMWWELTGKPFVFALWAVRKDFAKASPNLVSSVLSMLVKSKNYGIREIDKIALSTSEKLRIPCEVIKEYYTLLSYDLGSEQQKGLMTFFDNLYQHGLISHKVNLSFFR